MTTSQEFTLTIEGMDCADCAAKLEKGIGRLDGVKSCTINFATTKMNVSYDTTTMEEDAIIDRVRDLGYDIVSDAQPAPEQPRGLLGLLRYMRRRRQDTLTLLAGALTALAFALDTLGFPSIAVHSIYGAAIIAGGYYIAQKGVRGLWLNRTLDMNFLMSIAAIGAVFIGA